MRSIFLFLLVFLLMTTAAVADSAVELQILQEFFSQEGLENRSARLTGAALEEFTQRPMVGVYLPENAKVTFRLLMESEITAIYEATVDRDGLAEMWSAFFHRGVLGSKLEAIKSLKIPPYLAAVEYQRLRTQSVRSPIQEARLTQLQRLFMPSEKFREHFNQNRITYEALAHLVETGRMEEAEAAAEVFALVGVQSAAQMAPVVSPVSGKGQDQSSQPGCEVRVSAFLDSVLGLLHLPPGVSPPLMSAYNYIFVEPLAENWYLFRNIAAEPLNEKSAAYEK